MITFAAPAILLAGALAALVPLALHLIRRRPPTRAPLPTERFLAPDPRAAVRVSRPTDLLLLALRMLLLVLAGAAFARPAWLPAARGTREIVLLDVGAGMHDALPRAYAEARRRLIAPDGRARGELVLFDTAAVRLRRVAPATFAAPQVLPPSRVPSRYAAALGAIPGLARELRGADSVRVTLITAPRWGAWSDGIAPLRRAVWPGAIDLVALPVAPAATDTATRDTSAAPARAVFTEAGDRRLDHPVAALEAVGWDVAVLQRNQPLPAAAKLIVATAPLDRAAADAVVAAARAGATVLVDGPAAASFRDVLPWRGTMRVDSAGGAMWLASGEHVAGAAVRVSGDAVTGAATLASWDDGRPAAAARRLGRGCIVFAATELERGEMVLDPSYPRALDRLARGCESPVSSDPDAPLDAGARAVLRGTGPAVVAAGALPGTGGGIALGRWVMAAAVLVALVETFFAYRRTGAA